MSSEPPDESPWLIDFFEEGDTHENASSQEPEGEAAGARRRPRRAPSGTGPVRARRLAFAVVGVLVIATVVIFELSGGSEAGADTTYLSQVAAPAHDSQNVGTALGQLFSAAPSSMSALEQGLRNLLSRQQRALSQTAAISPPPRLRSEHEQAISAMQFRVGGLSGLLRGFREAAARPAGVDWPAQLSIQAERLITSDVIWSEFFVGPADAQVASDGDSGSRAPSSTFVANAGITAPAVMAKVLARAQGRAATPASQNAVLKLGDTGAAVEAWQRELNKWIARQPGIAKLTLSGTFDQATELATMALQTAEKITADGIVGPMTRAALATALG